MHPDEEPRSGYMLATVTALAVVFWFGVLIGTAIGHYWWR